MCTIAAYFHAFLQYVKLGFKHSLVLVVQGSSVWRPASKDFFWTQSTGYCIVFLPLKFWNSIPVTHSHWFLCCQLWTCLFILREMSQWVDEQCAKASTLLGYGRRNTRLAKSTTVRRSAYLTLVRSSLGYATQVWFRTLKIWGKLEWVQRRATKYILNLPFICDQTYKDRHMKLTLLPMSICMIFFFEVVTGTVKVSSSVLPQVLVTSTTRSNSNRNFTHFLSRKCNTVTFQRSFFNRTPRGWNTLANDLQLSRTIHISQFKSLCFVGLWQRSKVPREAKLSSSRWNIKFLLAQQQQWCFVVG